MEKEKKWFLIGIEALRSQYEYDIDHAKSLSNIYKNSEIPVYNNGVLVNTIVKMLADMFDQPKKAEMEIHNYMYETDFGKHTGTVPSELWDMLCTSDLDNFSNDIQ